MAEIFFINKKDRFMERDVIIGCFVTGCALSIVLYLLLWSRKTIDFISRKNLRSVRDIIKALNERR